MEVPGAPWIDRPYDEQLAEKQELLNTLFRAEVPLIPHPDPLRYRNRVDMVCTPKAIGHRKEGQWDAVVDMPDIPLATERINEVYKKIRQWVDDLDIECVDPKTQEGWLRYIHIREGVQVQVALITKSDRHEQEVDVLFDRLNIASLHWLIAEHDNEDTTTREILGEETIDVLLGGKRFAVRPQTFFQTSPHMAQVAIERMREYVPKGQEILDLYCGVGTLGIALDAARLTGIDSVPESIAEAQDNARRNDVDADFIVGDAARLLAQRVSPDIVLVDPPRTGLQTGALTLLSAKPRRILYLSCNPRTQARDLAQLRSAYDVVFQEAYDFFPHTPHVESLVVLDRK